MKIFMGIFVMKNKTFHKKKILVVFLAAFILILYLIGRLVYLMVFDAEYYQQKAEDLHERERDIKAARGEIIDRNGTVLATNRTVCTISVIHSQIENPEKVRLNHKFCGISDSSRSSVGSYRIASERNIRHQDIRIPVCEES